MSDSNAACPYSQEADIETRYLAGQLSDTDAEAFEAHYFSCDRCFMLLERGAELRAAIQAAHAASTPKRRRTVRWRAWAAAAAGIVIVAGLWRTLPPTRTSSPPAAADSDVVRGEQGNFALDTHATDAALLAFWRPRKGASSYRVRLLTANGSLLFERETGDTGILLSLDSLPDVRARAPVYWQVQALDRLRGVVATSAIVQAPLRRSRP